jgi:hypothetical protein
VNSKTAVNDHMKSFLSCPQHSILLNLYKAHHSVKDLVSIIIIRDKEEEVGR